MNKVILHPNSRQQLDAYLQSPSHALLIVGLPGIGKTLLARSIAENMLKLSENGLQNYPYAKIVSPNEKMTIGIEVIREIEHFLSLKVPTGQENNRFILIEDGHNMTVEAQNALLKTLEEPPLATFIIMTASSTRALLPTILSRMQRITLPKPPENAVQAHFTGQGHSHQAIQQSYIMSGGLPAVMNALLTQTDNPLLTATESARQLLGQTTYERLKSVDELSKQRALVQDLLFIMQQMADLRLRTATGKALVSWKKVLQATYNTEEALAANAQPKLALINLMLQLS